MDEPAPHRVEEQRSVRQVGELVSEAPLDQLGLQCLASRDVAREGEHVPAPSSGIQRAQRQLDLEGRPIPAHCRQLEWSPGTHVPPATRLTPEVKAVPVLVAQRRRDEDLDVLADRLVG